MNTEKWKLRASERSGLRRGEDARTRAICEKYEGKTCVRASAAGIAGAFLMMTPGTLFLGAGVILILGSSITAKVFTCYSHPLSSLSASGLRLETAEQSDKEISEVYFAACAKKFLTQNLNRRVPKTSNDSASERG